MKYTVENIEKVIEMLAGEIEMMNNCSWLDPGWCEEKTRLLNEAYETMLQIKELAIEEGQFTPDLK